MHARNKPLRGGFLIPGGAVDLTCTVEARYSVQLQRGAQCAGVDVVIFHCISRHHHLHPRQSIHLSQHGELHVGRKRCRNPVGINQFGIQALGLQKNLMSITVAKPVDLVFD